MASTTVDPTTRPRRGKSADPASEASINQVFDRVMELEPNQFAGAEAREAAARHISELGRISDQVDRRFAANMIATIADVSDDYKAYLLEHSSTTIAEAEQASTHFVALEVAKEERKAAELGAPIADAGRWTLVESVPDALMRSNFDAGVVEVQEAGQTISLPGLAAIDQWCEAHDASPVDKERLVSLGIAASRSREADSHSSSQHVTHGGSQNMEASQAQPRQEITRIGSNMPKPDWQESINLLKAAAPGERGKVYLPKAEAEYGGKVLLITDTHLVQRVGRGTAVAHDLSKLDNGAELSASIDAGTLRPGAHMRFEYGLEKGQATVIPFNQQRATEMQRDLTAWAEKNLTNQRGRETFLKHVAAAAKDLGQPRSEQQRGAAAAQPRERTLAPQRDR